MLQLNEELASKYKLSKHGSMFSFNDAKSRASSLRKNRKRGGDNQSSSSESLVSPPVQVQAVALDKPSVEK